MTSSHYALARISQEKEGVYTAQTMKFSIKDFFSKCEQICMKLRKKSH